MTLQDQAAGGADMRLARLPDGEVVRIAISIRHLPRVAQWRRYAYLQFKHAGKTVTKYVGCVTAGVPERELADGWVILNATPIEEKYGWSWLEPRG